MMVTRSIAILALTVALVRSFVPAPTRQRFGGDDRQRTATATTTPRRASPTSTSQEQDTDTDRQWANWGIFLSSFSDGLRPNPQAQDFLRQGLVRALLTEEQVQAESAVENSAVQSPCCGPNLDAVDRLSETDAAVQQQENHPDPLELLQGKRRVLRFVYIPTAMYALRSGSEQSPGKQRQRGRADGKKRRNEIVALLQDLMGADIKVHAVTLDIDDGSVKQPDGSDDASVFPVSGKDAVRDWNPHLVYVQGGNTFWLHHCMEKGDWKQDLVDLCCGPRNAVYIGTSAGAILMGQAMQTACWKGWDDPSVVPGMETYDEWQDVKGLGLAGDTSFFPHMQDQWEATVTDKQQKLASKVYCLTDSDAFCVNGSKQETFILSTAPVESSVSS